MLSVVLGKGEGGGGGEPTDYGGGGGGRCLLIFVWVPPFLFQHFSFCNINNQWAKFDKNLSAGSISGV